MRGNWKRLLALVLCCAMLCCLVPCTQASADAYVDEYGAIRYTDFEGLKELASKTYDEPTSIGYGLNGGATIVIEEDLTIPENLTVYGLYVEFVVPAGVSLTISKGAFMDINTLDVRGTAENRGDINAWFTKVSGTLRNSGSLQMLNGGESKLTVTGKLENTGVISIQGRNTDMNITGVEKITNSNGGETSVWFPFVDSNQEFQTILAVAASHSDISFSLDIQMTEKLTISENLTVPKNTEVTLPWFDGLELSVAKGCTLTNYGFLDLIAPAQIAGALKNEGQIKIMGEDKMTFASGSSYSGDGVLWVFHVENPQAAVNGLDLDNYLVLRNEWYYDDYVWGVWPKNVKADVTRLAGSNRFATAIKAADEMLADTYYGYFSTIIVANGYNFADALSGSYLANVTNAPILLCWSGDSKYDYLNDDVVEYIKANLGKIGGTVYLLGGTSAVPQSLENALTAFAAEQPDVAIKRLAGKDRFETNLMILEESAAILEKQGVQPDTEILVCTATNFADSLSASATGKPILLAFNEYGKLYGGQEAYLKTLKNSKFTIIGGESAVSAKLADTFKQFGSVSRLAGSNRFETSVLVAEKYFDDPHTAVLAYAWNFPDGLCGGPLAYSMDAPLILTMTGYESQAVKYFSDKAIINASVLGGDGLISDSAVRSIFALAKDAEILVK